MASSGSADITGGTRVLAQMNEESGAGRESIATRVMGWGRGIKALMKNLMHLGQNTAPCQAALAKVKMDDTVALFQFGADYLESAKEAKIFS
jgi:hypothetical protein